MSLKNGQQPILADLSEQKRRQSLSRLANQLKLHAVKKAVGDFKRHQIIFGGVVVDGMRLPHTLAAVYKLLGSEQTTDNLAKIEAALRFIRPKYWARSAKTEALYKQLNRIMNLERDIIAIEQASTEKLICLDSYLAAKNYSLRNPNLPQGLKPLCNLIQHVFKPNETALCMLYKVKGFLKHCSNLDKQSQWYKDISAIVQAPYKKANNVFTNTTTIMSVRMNWFFGKSKSHTASANEPRFF